MYILAFQNGPSTSELYSKLVNVAMIFMASCFVPPVHKMDSTPQPSLVSVRFEVTLNLVHS